MTVTPTPTAPVARAPGGVLRALLGDRFMTVVALVVSTLVVLALLVPVLATLAAADPFSSELAARLQPPGWLGGEGGLLGTDQLGRALWARMLYGLRTTFVVGAGAVLLGAIVGIAVGLIAGFFGGWLDAVLMRLADIQLSFPALLIAMTLVSMLGGGVTVLVVVLGLSSWMLYARVVRSVVLGYHETDFLLAERGLGASSGRIILRHLLPNCVHAIATVGTLELARLMLAEASLSFLGFGVQPPTISLGRILAQGQDYLGSQWWVSTFAGLLLATAVLSTNLIGNWLQRFYDPLQGT
jgi:peptide/nickel transport system permease protein